jgi:uncharacterized membrane protein YcaP (DUF421 family)
MNGFDQLREKGVHDLTAVKRAFVEPDGIICIVARPQPNTFARKQDANAAIGQRDGKAFDS